MRNPRGVGKGDLNSEGIEIIWGDVTLREMLPSIRFRVTTLVVYNRGLRGSGFLFGFLDAANVRWSENCADL